MDEIRKIDKPLKARNEDKRWHGSQEADLFALYTLECY